MHGNCLWQSCSCANIPITRAIFCTERRRGRSCAWWCCCIGYARLRGRFDTGKSVQCWRASELAELLIQAGMVRCGAVALRYYASQFNAGAVVGGETGQALRMSGSRQRKQCTQVNDKSKNFDLHVVSALEHSKNQFRAIISLKCPCPSR